MLKFNDKDRKNLSYKIISYIIYLTYERNLGW